MSHPYWPQSYYLFRPGGRRSQAPVPASMAGFAGDDFGGGRYEVDGTPAPRSWKRGVRTYGSMTPKYDYATPKYIRDEPSGMGYFSDFGDDEVSCASNLKDAVASYLGNKLCTLIKSNAASDAISQGAAGLACSGATAVISGTLGALAGISGDLSDEGIKQQVRDAVHKALPNISIPSIGFNITDALSGFVEGAIGAILAQCPALVANLKSGGGGGDGGGGFFLKSWKDAIAEACAAGEIDGTPVTAEACAAYGVPYKGTPAEQLQIVSGTLPSVKMYQPFVTANPISEMNEMMANAAMTPGKVQSVPQLTAQCAAAGGYLVAGVNEYGWPKYTCQPTGAGVPGAAAGAGSVAVLAGVAALAFLLFR